MIFQVKGGNLHAGSDNKTCINVDELNYLKCCYDLSWQLESFRAREREHHAME